jgi:hypothetical protein
VVSLDEDSERRTAHGALDDRYLFAFARPEVFSREANIAKGSGQPDTRDTPRKRSFESIKKTLQLHAALATHESVELVDDYVVEAIEKGRDSRAPVVEERLEGLWRYQNAAGPTLRKRLLSTGGHVSVPRHNWYF